MLKRNKGTFSFIRKPALKEIRMNLLKKNTRNKNK